VRNVSGKHDRIHATGCARQNTLQSHFLPVDVGKAEELHFPA